MDNVESLMVDSNVFIDFLRAGKNPALELAKKYATTDLVTCGMVKGEVLRGIKSLALRDKLETFFGIMCYVDSDTAIWNHAWQLAWTLDRRGRVLPFADIIIATCALRAECAVLTSDRHFDHIPGLMVMRP